VKDVVRDVLKVENYNRLFDPLKIDIQFDADGDAHAEKTSTPEPEDKNAIGEKEAAPTPMREKATAIDITPSLTAIAESIILSVGGESEDIPPTPLTTNIDTKKEENYETPTR
jgi:hypothetical protein